MRELVWGKNTIDRTAAVLKSPIKRPSPSLEVRNEGLNREIKQPDSSDFEDVTDMFQESSVRYYGAENREISHLHSGGRLITRKPLNFFYIGLNI